MHRAFPTPIHQNYVTKLSGAAAVLRDRETWPSHEEITTFARQGFRVMNGAHPKVILTDAGRQTVKTLVQHPEVSALGKVGLDHISKPDL